MTAQTIRISSRASMLAVIPQLLSFEPQESFVAVFLRGHSVVVTMRIDLKDLAEADFLDRVAMVVEQTDADSVVLVAYTDDERDDLGVMLRGVQMDVEARMAVLQLHLEVVEAITVIGQTWRSLVTLETGSMDEVRTDPVAVRGIFEGRRVARSRQELAESVRPGSEALLRGFGTAFQQTMTEMAELADDEVVELVREHLDQWWAGRIATDGPTLGRLVALGTQEAAAPPVLARLTSKSSKRWHELWSAAVRCSQGSAALLPLVASAVSAWATGDGATMNVATDHAASIDPDHVMVQLLRRANDQCASPELWDSFVDKLHESGLAG